MSDNDIVNYPDPHTDGGDQVEKPHFLPSIMPARLEYKEDVQDVGGQVWSNKRDDVGQAEIKRAHTLRNRFHLHVENPDEDIRFSQRRKKKPCDQEEGNHIHAHRRDTADRVFKELYPYMVFFKEKPFHIPIKYSEFRSAW